MSRAIFLGGLCALSFLVGAAAVTFEAFPYRQFREARFALDALVEAMGGGLPAVFHGYDLAYDKPTAFGSRRAEAGPVLIAGGPYELTSRCPGQGCLAWITDRRGEVAYSWPLDLEAAWGEFETVAAVGPLDRMYPVGLHLFDNGDLLVSFQSLGTFPWAVGMAKVDATGRLLWKRENLGHHWFSIDEAGRIYVPAMRVVPSPIPLAAGGIEIVCELDYIYEDLIQVLDRDGNLVKEFPLLNVLMDSGWPGLLHYSEDLSYQSCDPTHLNDVQVLPAALAAEYPGLAAGDLLISMRTNNALAVLDGDSGRVKWLLAGRTVAQHGPRFIGGNKIIVFANKNGAGADNYSRLVEIDLGDGAMRTLFPTEATADSIRFHALVAGHLDVNPDRRHVLVSLTGQGRVLELDLATGQVVWEYVNTHRVPGETRPIRMSALAAYYVESPAFLAPAHAR
ncbi:MAG TPA: arylsulfotransferase family protein [Alphaproteobacteria bacterium]